MSCKVEGLDNLIDKLETMFSDKEIKKIEKKALEPITKSIKSDMQRVSPVCDEPEIHGRDVIGIKYKKNSYEIGLWSEEKWDLWRGLWFSQYSSYRNPYYKGWFDKFCDEAIQRYREEAKESLRKEIMKNLK